MWAEGRFINAEPRTFLHNKPMSGGVVSASITYTGIW
jgi:hypothetical protein